MYSIAPPPKTYLNLLSDTVLIYDRCRVPKTDLELAIESQNYTLIEDAINCGADLSMKYSHGNTALHLAMLLPLYPYQNHSRVLQTIIKNSEDIINKQNVDGNTALHIAIMRNADFDVLKTLIENGSSVSIKNKSGLDPIELVRTPYFDTYLSLLRLQKFYDYRDRAGNTVLHLSMAKSYYEGMWTRHITSFWNIKMDFNLQNDNGQTPLHLAGSREEIGANDLDFIFYYFGSLDLFLTDDRGDTFLHTYFKHNSDTDHIFVRTLFDGKYRCCSKDTLKALLRSENNHGYTPFLIFAHCPNVKLNQLQMFLKAGAEFNVRSGNGETLLHCMLLANQSFRYDFSAKQYAITNGADVNAQDMFGETPIFLAIDVCSLQSLIDAGADVNKRNKFGQTVLMSLLCSAYCKDILSDVVKILVGSGADVNIPDIHGNSLLHYAAWKGVGPEVVRLLKEYGCRVVPDKLGLLPCKIAEQQGNTDVIADLCICEDNYHQITFLEELIGCIEQRSNKLYDCTFKSVERFIPGPILNGEIPGLGRVHFEGEANCVRVSVKQIITEICKRIGEEDEYLSNTIFMSGSAAENTKVGIPNEFDFICEFSIFTKICVVDEVKPSHVYLKLKDEYMDTPYRIFFDQNCHLNSDIIFSRFNSLFEDISQNPDIYSGSHNIAYSKAPVISLHTRNAPNIKMKLLWSGCLYKHMIIKIDIVPAVQTAGWWPPCTNFGAITRAHARLKEKGALVLLKRCPYDVHDMSLRISAMTAEMALMAQLPQIARDSYAIAKCICSDDIRPRLLPGDTNITSYMLKNCMFHVFAGEGANADNMTECDRHESKFATYPTKMLHESVCRILKMLILYSSEERLPCYIFPWQNIFHMTFQTVFGVKNEVRRECARVTAFSKVFLEMFGGQVLFTKRDIDVLSENEEENEGQMEPDSLFYQQIYQ